MRLFWTQIIGERGTYNQGCIWTRPGSLVICLEEGDGRNAAELLTALKERDLENEEVPSQVASELANQ